MSATNTTSFVPSCLLEYAQEAYYPAKTSALGSIKQSLENGLEASTFRGAPLGKSIEAGMKVGILFDDVTRPTPAEEILPVLLKYLCDYGVEKRDITLVHAAGLHLHDSYAIERKLGPVLAKWHSIVDHDSRNSPMSFKGITDYGTPVWVNSLVDSMDILIGIGTVAPHMDAGFSGGYKIVMPGICSKKTVDTNHKLMLSPRSMIGKVAGNPVSEDINQAGSMIGLDYVINTVMTSEGKVHSLFCGDVLNTQSKAIDEFLRTQITDIPNKSKLVIAYVRSGSFAEALKGIVRANLVTEKGGRIVLYGPNIRYWAQPGCVKTFATFPEEYLDKDSQQLAEMVVTNNLNETRHGTAAFNIRKIMETNEVIVIPNMDYLVEAKLKTVNFVKSMDCIIGNQKPLVLMDACGIYPQIHRKR